MKFKAANQLSVKNSYIKYYENLTNSLAADARSQTDGQGLHITSSFFTLYRMPKFMNFTLKTLLYYW